MRATLLAALATTLGIPLHAQQPQWSPSRLPENSTARPLNPAQSYPPSTSDNQSAFLANSPATVELPNNSTTQAAQRPSQQLGAAVTLRWKTVAPTAASNAAIANNARLRQQVTNEVVGSPSSRMESRIESSVSTAAASNPLRSQVIQAAYQQNGAALQSPGTEDLAPPALPQRGADLPSLPTQPGMMPGAPSQLPPPQFDMPLNNQPLSDALPPPNVDPLDQPELPPPPTGRSDNSPANPDSILENTRPSNPFPKPNEEPSPADRSGGEPELVPPPREKGENLKDEDSEGPELERRKENTNSGYCDEMRARIHANPITAVSLDVSPKFGAGFKAKKDPEQQRLDFAASAPVREWTDYRGYVVASGRMIDLRDGRVVIDVGGREQSIPLRDLSDVDTTYVGESWNIPERCGTGYDPLDGRSFVPSTVQWAASGLCHKPLYFEQVQLERYGHEIGPVLQPILGTAHFFGNIPLLPYKMGIHPPWECQYPLGYYRPGNCAPYMLQPIPWSLRGAAVQAAAVTGAAALIP